MIRLTIPAEHRDIKLVEKESDSEHAQRDPASFNETSVYGFSLDVVHILISSSYRTTNTKPKPPS